LSWKAKAAVVSNKAERIAFMLPPGVYDKHRRNWLAATCMVEYYFREQTQFNIVE
jgi:hypothetical protein